MGFLQSISRAILKEEIQGMQNQISLLKNENETLKAKIEQIISAGKFSFPKSYGKITLKEELEILRSLTGAIQITDNYLQLTTVEEAKKFSAETKVFLGRWTTEDHDCDNFAAALWGYFNTGLWSYAFGYARSAGHAFNIFIDEKKQVWIVEPQTNQYMTLDEAKRKSTPDGLSYWPITFIQM